MKEKNFSVLIGLTYDSSTDGLGVLISSTILKFTLINHLTLASLNT